ncbi:MarR family transcriptional regulator [Bacillus sp. FJAT-42376]|nr:MarR family transcriptional regulator [Bacillus sp. FJAT-42376]
MEGLLRRVFRQLRQGVNHILEKDITRNEFFILRALHSGGASKASELSKVLDVSASHITSMADSLVEKGYIDRIRADSDRRMVNISITEEGEKKLHELEKRKTDYLFERFENLDAEELQLLVHLFKKLDTDASRDN